MDGLDASDRPTAFARRERMLNLLRQQPGIRVPELAQSLHVSQGTIRNDLEALQEAGRLVRVRGGAVSTGEVAVIGTGTAPAQRSAEQIARWAAELVSDGDSLLLDASPTVARLVPFLQERRRLTVVTNGLEVATALARKPGNNVILLGGTLRGDGTAVAGALTERLLEELHVKLAFISCTGLTLESGLTEEDIDQAQVKGALIAAADASIALVESQHFGKRDLSSFARLDQIARVFTDDALDPTWIAQLQQTSLTLTVCGAETLASFTPARKETRHFKLGFANLTERLLFPVDVRRSLERAAEQAGNVDIVIADNHQDAATAIEVADALIAQRPDVVIEYQIDASAGDVIMAKFRQAQIPVIAVDIPMVGATFFGVDNYRAGYMAGMALGEWLRSHWGSSFDRLLVLEEPRAGPLPAARIRGQLDGVKAVIGAIAPERLLSLASGNTAEASAAQVGAALDALPELRRLAVISFNDDVALGAIAAGRLRGRAEQLVVVGQGADRNARAELRRPGSRLIGSTAYMPERYGERLLALAAQLVNNDPVPPAVYMDHVFITSDNVDVHYPE